MAIITISRQDESLGDEIAASVAKQLGYTCIDKTKMIAALTAQGVDCDDVEKYDEKKPSIWHSFTDKREKILHLIKAAVYDYAALQDVVIVGRGSQVLLEGFSGILHVRIMAPHDVRLLRSIAKHMCTEKEAKKVILANDKNSAEYIEAYFKANWEDQNRYDLILNTRTISLETGSKLIMEAVKAIEFNKRSQPEAEELLDRALTHKAMAALMDIAGLDISSLRIKNCVAELSVSARSKALKDVCHRAISGIEGVKETHIQIEVVDIITDM